MYICPRCKRWTMEKERVCENCNNRTINGFVAIILIGIGAAIIIGVIYAAFKQ